MNKEVIMYLYVMFTSPGTAYDLAMAGIPNNNANARLVRVKLTEEQIEQLRPRTDQTIGGKVFPETVEPISIQED
jgi:hypothetical protein